MQKRGGCKISAWAVALSHGSTVTKLDSFKLAQACQEELQ